MLKEGLTQERCVCGNRSFYIFCWHKVEYNGKTQSDSHNWILVCVSCGKYLENDNIFYDMHQHDYEGV